MFAKLILAATIVAVASSFPAEEALKHYDGYRVIRAVPESYSQLEGLITLANSGKYDFWQDPRPGGSADIMASPSTYHEIADQLNHFGIPHSIMISDVEQLINEERLHKKSRPLKSGDMDWENYHRWEEVNAWLSKLVSENADTNLITEEVYGSSFENRTLKVYKVSTGGRNKTAFWIDATIHAREHITTGVITFIMNQLVNNSTRYSDILDKVDFYFAPFINPDGYEYTFTNDRMWRRTRTNWNPGSSCRGVDANRNFGFQFGGPGSSNNPCSETYRGPQAYSEPETEAVKEYILAKAKEEGVNWQGFITLHSYSQLWMSPYGYTETPPSDYAELKRIGDAAAAALRSHFNTPYQVGNAGAILYLSSGSSRDWAKGEGGFNLVYTIELRDTGRYGFLLPADQILDTSIETWSGIQVVARELAKL